MSALERLRRLPQPRGSRLPSDQMSRSRLSRNASEVSTAFVLAGGGNLGAIQAGMLRALSEHKIRPDLILGCSVGAINGAAFATDPTLAGARLLETRWRNVTAEAVMPPGRLPGAVQLVRKGESIHPNQGLRELIESFLGGKSRFEDLSTRFECVATDMAASAEKWFNSGSLIGPLLASAALPAVFPPVEVNGRRYLDGGVVNNVPLSRAMHLGAERIYVLHVGSHGRPETSIRRPIEAALIGYWIARNCRFANDLNDIPAGVQVVVMSPEIRPDLRYDDFSETDALISDGYMAASAVLASDEYRALPNPQPRWMRALSVARPGQLVGAASIVESTLASRATAEEPPVDAASESAPASAEAAPYDATQESTHGLETAQAMLDDLTP